MESLFLQSEGTLCEIGLLQRRMFVSGQWEEEESPGLIGLGDGSGGVRAAMSGKGD